MKISIELGAQLREVFGQQYATVELSSGQTLLDAVKAAATQSENLQDRLLSASGDLLNSVMVFVNEQPVATGVAEDHVMNDGDKVLLLPPISGG